MGSNGRFEPAFRVGDEVRWMGKRARIVSGDPIPWVYGIRVEGSEVGYTVSGWELDPAPQIISRIPAVIGRMTA